MSYPGGKNGSGVYQRIINLMPPHDTYVEPFLGGGAVMLAKRPAKLNIGLDLSRDALNQVRAAAPVKIDAVGRQKWQWLRRDAIAFLEGYPFKGRELVYCDPPYVHATRSRTNLYEFEMTDGDHARLLDVLLGLPCFVMISGYWTELYGERLARWNRIEYQARTRGGTTATEHLWFNFDPPDVLHDYRYLGDTFRDRERIRRKVKRWVSRVEALPPLERQALLSAIGETCSDMVASPNRTMPDSCIAESGDACRRSSPELAIVDRLSRNAGTGEARVRHRRS